VVAVLRRFEQDAWFRLRHAPTKERDHTAVSEAVLRVRKRAAEIQDGTPGGIAQMEMERKVGARRGVCEADPGGSDARPDCTTCPP